MSHIVTITIKVKDEQALRAACNRLGLPAPEFGTHDVFGQQVTGHGVQLNGWTYKAVFDLRTGEGKYDNYEGRWGKQVELDRFMQGYSIELAKKQMRAKGFNPTEEARQDGSVVIRCVV